MGVREQRGGETAVAALVPRHLAWSVWLYALFLRLYPRSFYRDFGDEMVDLFAEATADAWHQGWLAGSRFWLNELLDWPVAVLSSHWQQRRKNRMNMFSIQNSYLDVRLARWLARGLSLVAVLFTLSIILWNEDVRQTPTPATVALVAMAALTLLAWWWEREGGFVVLVGSFGLFLALLYQSLSLSGLLMPIWTIWLIDLGMAGYFAAIGWLFMSVSRYEQTWTQVAGTETAVDPHKKIIGFLFAGMLALAGLAVFALGFNVPAQRQISQPSFGHPAVDELVWGLQQQGAVVGISSISPQYETWSEIRGQSLVVDNEEVEVFAYADAAAAAAALANLASQPATERVNWTVYQSGQLVVVSIGGSARVEGMLTAVVGPPLSFD